MGAGLVTAGIQLAGSSTPTMLQTGPWWPSRHWYRIRHRSDVVIASSVTTADLQFVAVPTVR